MPVCRFAAPCEHENRTDCDQRQHRLEPQISLDHPHSPVMAVAPVAFADAICVPYATGHLG
jgi:hypothetical protein